MEFILIGVLVLLFALMIFMQARRRRTMVSQQNEMFDRLRPGMRIKTVAGTIGRIKEIREESPHLKTILLETGTDKNSSFLLIDMQAVLSIVDDPFQATVITEETILVQEQKALPPVEAPVKEITEDSKPEAVSDAQVQMTEAEARDFVEKSTKSRAKKNSK